MTIKHLTIQLPDDIAQKAEILGLFDEAILATLIMNEVLRQRQEALGQLLDVAHQLQPIARDTFGELSEAAFQAMVEDELNQLHEKNI